MATHTPNTQDPRANGKQNFPDNVLYEMDNLDVLRGMNSETVDLIATDPPFNTERNRAGSAGFYVDKWKWGDTGILPDQWMTVQLAARPSAIIPYGKEISHVSIGQLLPNINVLQRTRVTKFHPTPEADDRHGRSPQCCYLLNNVFKRRTRGTAAECDPGGRFIQYGTLVVPSAFGDS